MIAIGLAVDLLWWFVADRSARRAGWGRGARVLPALFALAQAAWLVSWFSAPELDLTPAAPAASDFAGLAWHVVLVPLTLLATAVKAVSVTLSR